MGGYRLTTRESLRRNKYWLRIKNAYESGLTYQKVGEKFGISRERVRQILRDGCLLNIFPKVKKHYESKRESITHNIASFLPEANSLNDLTIKLNVTPVLLVNECLKHGIKLPTPLEFRKRRISREYATIVKQLGHHPSTTEMITPRKYHAVNCAIFTTWGGIKNFRKEYGIEFKSTSPYYRANREQTLVA